VGGSGEGGGQLRFFEYTTNSSVNLPNYYIKLPRKEEGTGAASATSSSSISGV